MADTTMADTTNHTNKCYWHVHVKIKSQKFNSDKFQSAKSNKCGIKKKEVTTSAIVKNEISILGWTLGGQIKLKQPLF